MIQPKEKAKEILIPFINRTSTFRQAKDCAALAVSLAAGVASQTNKKMSAYWLEVRDEIDQLKSID